MPRFTTKSYDQLLSQYLAQVISRTGLTDVADTSVFKHLGAAFCRMIDELYYQQLLLLDAFSIDRASGDDLDERAAEIQPATLTRIQAAKATGSVVFSRPSTTGTITVTVGTRVKTASGIEFQTTADVTITPTSPELVPGHGIGRDGEAPIIAVVAGAAGNVVSGTITRFNTKPPVVTEVTNLDPTVNGADKEIDDAFRARIKAAVLSLPRSTVVSLESAVLGATDTATGAEIKFSKVWEDPANLGRVILYIDDGTGGALQDDTVTGEDLTDGGALGGETELFTENKPLSDTPVPVLTSSVRGLLVEGTDYVVNLASGQVVFDPALVAGETVDADYTYYTGLIALAQKIVDGDPTDRATYPGVRAAGTYVRAMTPDLVLQNVVVSLWVQESYSVDSVKTQVKDAIKSYINSLSISDDVLVYEIIEKIMGVPGVKNAVLTEPAADVIVLDDQLARTEDSRISVN